MVTSTAKGKSNFFEAVKYFLSKSLFEHGKIHKQTNKETLFNGKQIVVVTYNHNFQAINWTGKTITPHDYRTSKIRYIPGKAVFNNKNVAVWRLPALMLLSGSRTPPKIKVYTITLFHD